MSLDRKYLTAALMFAVLGMLLGTYMGASHVHVQYVTHAHILLVGFVSSTIYAVIHKLWLQSSATGFAKLQFVVHIVGVTAMVAGLFLLYGNFLPAAVLDPILGLSSVAVLIGAGMMLVMVLKSNSP